LEVGNERRATIKGNSIVMLEAEEQHTVSGDRKVELQANDYLHVADSSHNQVGQTLVIDAGQQVHIKAGAHVVLSAEGSISLQGGGQHLVIGPGGIFSSTEIQIGGAALAGLAVRQALPAELAELRAPVLAQTQYVALLNKKSLCVVCQAAQAQQEQSHA
ncbi:MAG: type VI secretion system tip protein VgrG, partial [Pseudomonas sp.]